MILDVTTRNAEYPSTLQRPSKVVFGIVLVFGTLLLANNLKMLVRLDINISIPDGIADPDAHKSAWTSSDMSIFAINASLSRLVGGLATNQLAETGVPSYEDAPAVREAERHKSPYISQNDASIGSPENVRLELIHIPKSGGTMLEVVALHHNITWGACHFHFMWKFRKGNKLKDCPNSLRNETELKNSLNKKDSALWHYPLSALDQMNLPFDPYDNLKDELMRNKTKKFFIVIRNPYDRLLSLHYMTLSCTRSPEAVSEWIRDGIINRSRGNGFTPSSDYVYRNSTAEEKERVVDHILHFERMQEDFAKLMDQYHLPLQIPAKKINGNECTETAIALNRTRVTAHELTRETLDLINEVFAEDFILGGYSMI